MCIITSYVNHCILRASLYQTYIITSYVYLIITSFAYHLFYIIEEHHYIIRTSWASYMQKIESYLCIITLNVHHYLCMHMSFVQFRYKTSCSCGKIVCVCARARVCVHARVCECMNIWSHNVM